ncbi:MAG: glucose-1-phosphate thymidylyltransferase RfbA [Acidimicrobiia bacterium]|nr:glucose-1-phosphate thymidylyltransferase RfbA [Acidimicrobiia bacterium]
MKGIILAGGAGSRLDPITRVASKQLQPVYDKPMIYYPIATLLQAGIRDILVITTPADRPRFEALLDDGSQFGVSFRYATQPEPKGIAQAFLVGADFLGGDPVALVLGDNIFYGELGFDEAVASFDGGALIFAYPVSDPRRYGVVQFDGSGTAISLEEKPLRPRSRYAVPGMYLYGGDVVAIAGGLQPSDRGELEITDLNRVYLEQGRLRVRTLGRGVAWLDSGTHDSLLDAANFIATIEHRQGTKIACLEEVAYRAGYLDRAGLGALVADMPASGYRAYLEEILAEEPG